MFESTLPECLISRRASTALLSTVALDMQSLSGAGVDSVPSVFNVLIDCHPGRADHRISPLIDLDELG
jgi:hypothetical protein